MLVFTEEEELFPFLLLLQFLPDHRFKQLFLVVPRLFVADEAQVLKQHFPAHNFSPQILINKSSNQQIVKSIKLISTLVSLTSSIFCRHSPKLKQVWLCSRS